MIKADDSILQEIMEFVSEREQCQLIDLLITSEILVFSNLEIHLREQTVYLNNTIVPMSHYEFFILSYLAQHPGWIFTKEQIYNIIYNDNRTVDINNAVYCLIRNLRKKLKHVSKSHDYIQTVRGIGYKFVIPEE